MGKESGYNSGFRDGLGPENWWQPFFHTRASVEPDTAFDVKVDYQVKD